jgi:poly-gamma-glutamate synthesis protein (capsule biosynthesis protein)
MIEAGADAILGHHHHMVHGIEYYKGKPIFYGLGNFALDIPNFQERILSQGYLTNDDPQENLAFTRRFGDYTLSPRDRYPLLPFHPDARMTMVASLVFSGKELHEVEVIPCMVDPSNSPHLLAQDDPNATLVLEYLKKNCDEEFLPTTKVVYMRVDKENYARFQILPINTPHNQLTVPDENNKEALYDHH